MSSTRVVRGDISKQDPEELMAELGLAPGDLDALVGGPPCQSFSTAGRRGTIGDARGMLLWQFSRYVAAFRPKFFLMENVRGLLSAAVRHRHLKDRPDRGGRALAPDEMPGSVVERWLRDLQVLTESAYRVDCFEVNAVNYGAPQLRERALFFGNRLGREVDFPAPTHSDGNGFEPFNTLGRALQNVVADDGEILDFSPRKKRYLSMVPEGANWRALPVELQMESMGRAWHAKGGRSGWWRRLTRDLPSPTVVTMPNHAGTSMCHPTETRALTLRECAAVQEFPPEWEFMGTTAQKYAQVGNAIPVRLGEVAGHVLAEHLGRGDVPSVTSAPPYKRVYVHSHIRTRQWYRAGQTFVWVAGNDNGHSRYSARRKQPVAAAV
jgi:DNA (cytosine-5)-methyltransferase 1